MAPPPRLPAALMDELVEEVLIRIQPDNPKCLLRAALVCKRWCRIIANPGFRRRFREFHRTPPMLGFFPDPLRSSMIYTSSFRLPRAEHCYLSVIDARHGRVLLHRGGLHSLASPLYNAFVVWNPITGERRKLPLLPRSFYPRSWNAAVLCASTSACDHLDCQRGPFIVVLVGTDQQVTFSYVYSSETAAWSESASAFPQRPVPGDKLVFMPSALLGNTLYFLLQYGRSIMKYDLDAREMSLMDMPLECIFARNVLMVTEDGGLGIANVKNFRLRLWLRESSTSPKADAGWVRSGDINLKTLLPDEALSGYLHVAGFADGLAVIFLASTVGIFTIHLKTCRVKKICRDGWCTYNVPYMSFCTPALGAASTE